MIVGKTNIGTEAPLEDGVYCAEVYFGWKLLEWHDGEWWHTSLVSRWTASKPVQWVGPMPHRIGEAVKPSPMEFDL